MARPLELNGHRNFFLDLKQLKVLFAAFLIEKKQINSFHANMSFPLKLAAFVLQNSIHPK